MPQTTNHLPQSLSKHQLGTLKFIAEHTPTLAYLRKAHQTTLGSLAYRGYLRKFGHGDRAQVLLTPEGQHALDTYQHASLNERKHEFELTERCLNLLRHSRRIHEIRQAS